MTDYVRQHGTAIDFSTSESWVILSPIEKAIKDKIERVGIPLRDWDISINYGIKTGCNEAFIIDKAKRDELIKKDARSAEIIRPILRGRDIKRYSYEFADKYVIATFPSKKYNIDDYPTIRDYLLNYGKKKLEQSGKPGARKKTTHQWFETQDPIAYWDDFSKQKITWGNLNLRASFTLAPENMFINAPATMIIPGDEYLLGVLNSKISDYFIRKLGVTRNGGYFEYKPMFINPLPVPVPSRMQRNQIEQFVFDIIKQNNNDKKIIIEEKLDKAIFDLYLLTDEEKNFINSLS
jgi:hypothetical protein